MNNSGRLLFVFLAVATLGLILAGTLWPSPTAAAMASWGGTNLLRPSATPEAAVDNLAEDIRRQDWGKAYSSLANKGEFTESEFRRDLTGSYPSLRTYATVDSFETRPLSSSDTQADVQLRLRWSTVVGTFLDSRDIRVTKNGDKWEPVWPLVKEPNVPPQIIAVNYLRWDVIYRGPGDDWGAQDVEAPHVRIVDMHPVERGDGVMIMGELLNEDVVPAYVAVKASLLGKNGSNLGTEDSFDNISHLLLPKQVTPFLIAFHNVSLSQVDSVNMQPSSMPVAASADPVIEIANQKLNPAPGASLTGQLVNQSGQVVSVAHVLGTFYDKAGNVVWVGDEYVDRALLPETPVNFSISIPPDIASKVSSERAVTATYLSGGFQ